MTTSPRDFPEAKLWSRLGGPLLAAGAAAAIEALSRGGFTIPNPPAVLILIVVFSAFIGGLGSGLVTALPGRVDHLLAAGARAYLTKPLDVKKLLALLDEALKHEETGHGGPRA